MFTGLVERTGTLARRERRGPGFRLFIATGLGPLELGESICVNGACLTVVSSEPNGFAADVSLETAERTTLAKLAPESSLNLERSLRLGDRLGGHMLSGHVDGLARLLEVEPLGDARRMRFGFPSEYAPLVAEKGSVGLDGVSLTVNGVGDDWLTVMTIPHTLALTNLATIRPGSELNFEVDLLARYVARYLTCGARLGPEQAGGLERALERAGFLGPNGSAA